VPAGQGLPELTLECFTGREPVALAQLQKPAVINLWASWCAPCRDELPALQAFADEIGERVLVLGVNTDDTWNAAAWAGIDFGARYPNLFDPEQSLQRALGIPALPATLIVAADGSIVATDLSGTLTLEDLRALVSENIGLD
jgi:thiol-disulfide isomerase/thioredoxin